MSDFAIRNWAFAVGSLIGVGLYLLGRIDQRRRDLKKIRQFRIAVNEAEKLLARIKSVQK